MKCFVCSENITNKGFVKLFGKKICLSCINEIKNTSTGDVFYNFYKDRIKQIQKSILNDMF